LIAADLRKRRPKPQTIWHFDEIQLKIGVCMVYLWRVVDAEAEVPEQSEPNASGDASKAANSES
jgi:transposase-like protein